MKCTVVLFFCFIAASFNLFADEEINTKPLKARLSQSPANLKIGTVSNLEFNLELARPYHAYLDKFKIKVLKPEGLTIESMEISPVVEFMDSFSKSMKKGISESATLKAQVKTDAKTGVGIHDVELEITYQACTEKNCLFPTKLLVVDKIQFASSDMDEFSTKAPSAPTSLSIESAREKGLVYVLLFVFLAGVLTSLTPCIFPMIPITLSIIGASQIKGGPGSQDAKSPSKWRGFSLSVSYVLGIAITYATLGLIAARTGALFGAALSNPFVVVAIAIIFIALGLSMYGLFELQMPAFIRDSLGAKKTDAGYIGAFVAGLIAGVVASPCVGPVLVSILAYVAQTQNMLLGFWLLFTFAIGMGLLLVAIGTFSSLSKKLPRSGNWMEFVKFVFGSAMIGMAFYYLSPITPNFIYYPALGLACILISSYFGAFLPNQGLSAIGKMRKGSMVTLFAIGLIFIAKIIIFSDSKMPAIAGMISTDSGKMHSEWQSYDEKLFEEALSSGKPVIVDFYADWCAACKELEKFTFSAPEVQSDLKNFILFRADMTVETSANAGLKDKFKIMGLPTLHIFVKGKLISELTLTGFESKTDFKNRLAKALQK